MTIVFEDISIVISIVTVYLVFKNTFEDSDNYLNWIVILNVLAAFSALFISTFYQNNTSGTITPNNYLILLSYLLFLILVFLTLFVHKQKQIEAKEKKKVIPLT